MRILYFALRWAPVGGMQLYSRQVVATLRRLGHSVDVWSYVENKTELAQLDPTVRPLAPQSRTAQRVYFRVATWILAARLAPIADHYDLLIAGHPMTAPGVYLGSKRRKGLPYWMWTHGSDIWIEWSPPLRRALTNANRILTVSQYTRTSILDRLPEAPVSVIPNHVDLERFTCKPAPARAQPVLLSVSRIGRGDRYKGHDVVIQSLSLIQQRLGKSVRYQIAGRGDGIYDLRELAVRCGVEQSVDFLGYVEDAALPSLYQNCDVFILPSRIQRRKNGSLTGEGFGIVYIEAAACGKPVIASNQGGAVEALIHGVTGLAVDPTSVEQVVDAVCALLANLDLARRMGQAGRRFVEDNFSLLRFERRIAELLAGV